jgi:hypothetical protein
MSPIEAMRRPTKDEQIAVDLEKQTPRSSKQGGFPSQYEKDWQKAAKRIKANGSVAIDVIGERYEARLIKQGLQSRYRKHLQEGKVNFKLGTRLLETKNSNKYVILFYRKGSIKKEPTVFHFEEDERQWSEDVPKKG